MGSYVIDSRLFADQFSTPRMREIFSDETTVQRWLDVEAALAGVQASLGIIPVAAAAEIQSKTKVELLDLRALQAEMSRISHPIVPLIRAINDICEGGAGEYAHWGTTTQDILDTGTVLQLRDAVVEIEDGLVVLSREAMALARTHRETVMAGRSQGQHALPITFGYKVAVWLAELGRHIDRLDQIKPRLFVGQFGGAVGTLAALGNEGVAVQKGVMAALGLRCPEIAWHTSRDRIAELTCLFTMIAGTMANIANECYSLQRTEISELEEGFSPGKIGSSTMPHKRNPSTCGTILAIVRSLRGLPAIAIEGMAAEHERDYSVMQGEREFISRLCCLTHAAVDQTYGLLAGLTVRPENMRRNLSASSGLMLSEAVMMRLGSSLGRQEAHEIVYELCMKAFEVGKPLRELLLEDPVVSQYLSAAQVDELLEPENYLGLASAFVDQVVEQAATRLAMHESS